MTAVARESLSPLLRVQVLIDTLFQVFKLQHNCLGAGRRQLQKKRSVADGMIDPERDLYAIPSQDGGEIYFLSLVDILTHYGKCNLTFEFSASSFWMHWTMQHF